MTPSKVEQAFGRTETSSHNSQKKAEERHEKRLTLLKVAIKPHLAQMSFRDNQ
jgi:hypothetical protein